MNPDTHPLAPEIVDEPMAGGGSVTDLLGRLERAVGERVDASAKQRPDWPCRRGCSGCCERLAEAPRLHDVEWRRLEGAVHQLDADVRREVLETIRRTADTTAPVVCPFLDRAEGACRAYSARPISCRTYGFYVGRTGPRHCDLVTATVGDDAAVVWGNHDAVERQLEATGPVYTLAKWLGRGGFGDVGEAESEPKRRRQGHRSDASLGQVEDRNAG